MTAQPLSTADDRVRGMLLQCDKTPGQHQQHCRTSEYQQNACANWRMNPRHTCYLRTPWYVHALCFRDDTCARCLPMPLPASVQQLPLQEQLYTHYAPKCRPLLAAVEGHKFHGPCGCLADHGAEGRTVARARQHTSHTQAVR
jgi:hypothetical protein